ncbi:MAG: hypothetical protein CMF74_15460 [Maricaulis sp.]|nr:hypothetical protein [Maricaulis sp.]
MDLETQEDTLHLKEIQHQDHQQPQLTFKLLEEAVEQLQPEHLLDHTQVDLEEQELEHKLHHHLLEKLVDHLDTSQVEAVAQDHLQKDVGVLAAAETVTLE